MFLHLFDLVKAIKGLNNAADDAMKNEKATEKKIDKMEKILMKKGKLMLIWK